MSNVERLERVRGTTSQAVCLRLVELARRVPGDQAIVEIGAFEARATCFLAHGARRGKGAHVYGIDVWDQVDKGVFLPYRMHAGQHKAVRARMTQSHTRAKRNVVAQGMARYVSLIQGRSSDVASDWSLENIGLLVIDGDPRTESVLTDVASWFPYLTDDATIVFENYDPSRAVGVEVVTAVNQLVDTGALVLEEPDGLHIAVAHPATTLDQGKLVLPEPGEAYGSLRLEDETEPEQVKAEKIITTPLDETGQPIIDESVELNVKSDDDVKSELDAFAAEMGIDAEPGGALPPVPDESYPPDATPLPEPEYEDNSDDAASSEAQRVAEHPEPSPATNDTTDDESRSAPPESESITTVRRVTDNELEGMNVPDLRTYALKIGANVKGVHRRPDVLAAIKNRHSTLVAADELGQLGQELGT